MAKQSNTITKSSAFAAVSAANIDETATVALAILLSGDQTSHIWQASSTVSRAEMGVQSANAIAVVELKLAGIGNVKLQDTIRMEYLVGYMAARMFPNLENLSGAERDAVRAVMVLANPDSKAAERRTETQETLYKSAKKSWSRMLGYCEVATVSKQGGARARPAAESKPEGGKTAPAYPDARSASDEIRLGYQQSVMLLARANKARVAGLQGMGLMTYCQLVTTFHAGVNKLIAEIDAEAGK